MELLPDGTYRFRVVLVVVARQNGKSSLKRTISLWRLYMDGARLILGTAQDVSRAREQWNMCQETIHNCRDLHAEYDRTRTLNGDEWFRLKNGARYLISASNGKAARGGSYDEANIDELREQHDWRAWGAISKTTSARPKGQLWAMSNQGDMESVVLHQLMERAKSGVDDSIGLFEYSAPDGCELDDWDAIRQANPGLGHVLSPRAVMSSLGTDPPGVYRTEVLCQQVDQLDNAIDFAAWKDCADPSGSTEPAKDRLAACFDVSLDGKHATLVIAAKMDDDRVRLQVAGAWNSTEEARRELPGLLEAVKPIKIGWYPTGPGAAFAPILRQHAGNQEISGSKAVEACMGLADLARARQLIHASEPLLDAQVSGAQKLASGDGFRFTRRGQQGGHVDAVYAAAGAVQIACYDMPTPGRTRLRWVS
jgi:hypothetical protein